MGGLSRRGALLALSTLALAACNLQDLADDEKTLDLSAIEDAITAASPRVVRVPGLERVVSGLGHALMLDLVLDTPDPMTSDELDAILKAIWLSSPFEPNTIHVIAYVDDAQESPVDLRAPVTELSELNANAYSVDGISVTSMWRRYGEWQEPS